MELVTITMLLFLTLLVILTGGPRAAVAGVKAGVNAKIYRNTGTYGSPTWTAVGLVKDDTEGTPWDMVEAGARETKAKLYAKTRTDISESVVVRADDSDAGYNAFATAAESQTTVMDLLILDGPITAEGARGLRAEFLVNKTGKPKEIDGVIYVTFELKPTWTSNGYPSSVVMGASSAPTFTAF